MFDDPLTIAVFLATLAAVWLLVVRGKTGWAAVLLAAELVAGLFVVPSGLLFVWSALGLFALAVVAGYQMDPWRATGALGLTACMAWSFQSWNTSGPAPSVLERQARFPTAALGERLSYEDHTADARMTDADTPVGITPEMLDELKPYDEPLPDIEQDALRTIHDDQVLEFSRIEGFGVLRMMGASASRLRERKELADGKPELLPIPPTPEWVSAEDAVPEVITPPAPSRLLDLHRGPRDEFLDPIRFGVPLDFREVFDFRPHRVLGAQIKVGGWQVTRLELVSLLKHDTPRVYVSEELPAMDALADAPTRPLTDFESDALAQLRTESDLVIAPVTEGAPQTIRMLGSLRAGKVCAECHHVRRGELLGAFSYELHWFGEGDER